ncbi:allophanate hydrolase [Streptomyces sp. NPDC057908]|uniref:allophanate hydrolase n=1 Tax=Streptomyces sp. NPDC057908 TaxID=3346276 RepID=UPI0036EF24B9
MGDTVTAGQPLPALKAMKMESRVHAPAAGIVTEVLTRPGAQVEPGTALPVLAPPHKNRGTHMPTPTRSLVVTRVRAAYARIEAVDRPDLWIGLRPRPDVEAEARSLEARLAAGEHLPLAGRLLAVKGNIDVAGLPTTAGCPSYAYEPSSDAPVVARLRGAGALVIGTTNLDQFATGLVGTRSPYGAVRNALDPDRVSGGSSSGSAVAVALGIADLALGTDTAGSGRIPAAFNGIVGLKPTRGLVPTDGVVPACASLDCVTVFARTLPEAEQAMALMATPTPQPDHSRVPGPWRIAVPPTGQLGDLDPGWAAAYESTAARLRAAGAVLQAIDLTPFTEATTMLYEGAFVAERYTAVGAFIDGAPTAPDLDPTVARIITAARDIPAHQLFADQARLATLRTAATAALGDADALLLPTAPGHPTLSEVAADPLGANARLGRFTDSTNLFDLCAVAAPAGDVDGLPFGVMLIGPAHTDERLARIAALLTPPTRIAVVGAHLTGEPLNPQLLSLGARLIRTTTTAPVYRLYALRTDPPEPGLARIGEGGAAIEAELWELPAEGLGRLVAALPAPMTLGQVELADGATVTGFLCEPYALEGAADITSHGGWRAYLGR